MRADTIAAISTPQGPGAIGMVRLSGPDAFAVADRVFSSFKGQSIREFPGYSGVPGRIYKGDEPMDDAVAFVYRAPKSYTGEDVVELCCHGGGFLVKELLRLCFDAGAIPAEPGEFTKRAFLNGKMDLSQAEAVADLIGAQGEDAAKAAYAAREGALSRRIGAACEILTAQAAHIAAWSDYPEEDLLPVDKIALQKALEQSADDLSALLVTHQQGRLLAAGIATAIVGKPNVGKSTLMNLLSGGERSIVTDLPGTTRDVVEDTISLGGITLRLMDTAGIRDTQDVIEKIGVDRALEALSSADLILAVFDRSEALSDSDREVLRQLGGRRVIAVLNKSDLALVLQEDELAQILPTVVSVSAKTGDGREQLEATIRRKLEMEAFDSTAAILFHERQRRGVSDALDSVREGMKALSSGITLDAVSVCIEGALDSLYSLTGQRASDAVLDEVFSRFCVGK